MSVISTLVAQPNRIAIAAELADGFGEKGAAMEDLEKMLSPLPPQQEKAEDADSSERGGTTIAKGVLNEMLRLKILVRTDNENLRISPAFGSPSKKAEWGDRLYAYLFPILCSAESAGDHGQDELPEALCWLLQQSPTQPPVFSGGQHYDILKSQLGETDPLCTSIRNDMRYQNLIYWARFLGLAERLAIKPLAEKVIPDPTRAIAVSLPRLFSGERELTMPAFLQRLAAHIPVLDGGAVWQDIQGRLKTMQAEDKHVTQATSLALLRLELAGKIKLGGLSDATSRVLQVGQETRSVSHITYLEQSK